MKKPGTVGEYIATFPKKTQKVLNLVRATIHKGAPTAEETISYGIPTFDLHGHHLVHFAGYEHHIGFYPGASGIATFKKEVSKYKSAKGSVQFPIESPMPLGLIRKIVAFRVKESLRSAKVLSKKK